MKHNGVEYKHDIFVCYLFNGIDKYYKCNNSILLKVSERNSFA